MDASSSKDSETQQELQNFFPKVLEEIKQIKVIEPGNQLLPLARIKKIMKLDEDVKMISAEAPLLFAKATEIFIHELTLRAWLHTEDNKRRTLQRNDIAMAISKYDQFDFLIDIVPRDEIKPKKETETKTTVQPEVFYVSPSQSIQTVTVPNMSQAPTQTIQLQNGMQTTSPQQNIILQSPTQGQVPNLIQLGNPGQQIQLMQQVVSANGEISQIPVRFVRSRLIRNTFNISSPFSFKWPRISSRQCFDLKWAASRSSSKRHKPFSKHNPVSWWRISVSKASTWIRSRSNRARSSSRWIRLWKRNINDVTVLIARYIFNSILCNIKWWTINHNWKFESLCAFYLCFNVAQLSPERTWSFLWKKLKRMI